MSTERDPAAEGRLLAERIAARLRELLREGDAQGAIVRAGMPFDQVNRLRKGKQQNPTLRTIAMAAIAARVPVESLLLPPDPSAVLREPAAAPRQPSDERRIQAALRKIEEARKILAGDEPADQPAGLAEGFDEIVGETRERKASTPAGKGGSKRRGAR